MMADDTPLSDDEYAAMKARIAEEDARRAADARVAKLKPLSDLVTSAAFEAIRAQLVDAIIAAQDEPSLVQLQALQAMMAHLATTYTPAAA
jgi:hypothetical protein